MIRNNQNGRRRGRGGGGARPPQQGGGPSGNYGGSRIDTRQRGNATQLLEKYKAMARDATQNGDRVQAEFYMQYADHYFRVLNEFRARDPQASAPRSTYDDDDDAPLPGQYAAAADRGDAEQDDERAGNGAGDRGGYRAAGDRPRSNGYAAGRDDRAPPRDYAPASQRDAFRRDDGRRDDSRRDDARRDENRDGNRDAMRSEARDAPRRGDDTRNGGRDEGRDAPRREAQRDDGPRDGGYAPAPLVDAPREAGFAPVEPVIAGLPGPATLAPTFAAAEPATTADAGEAAAPRRRGRPRKIVVPDSVEG